MRKLLALICATTALSFLSADQVIMPCEHTYVMPHQMHIVEEGLVIELDGVQVIPASLQIDENGYYFSSVCYDKRFPGPWQCTKQGCLTWNEEWRNYCKQCGRPR